MQNLLSAMNLKGARIHMVGIKGVGMTALTEILYSRGAVVSGSDTTEVFYTDAILKNLGVRFYEEFLPEHITKDLRLVIYSSAYSRDLNCELKQASLSGLTLLSYPEALGCLSQDGDASGISGVHGKTTTTAMSGTILKELALPVTVLAGAAVPTFAGHSTYIGGERYFVAETCEYRRNFLNFRPSRIVITNIEEDHMDYFQDRDDIINAFTSYAGLLPAHGQVIYNCDDAGASKAVDNIRATRSDIQCIPYGLTAEGVYRITGIKLNGRQTLFTLRGFKENFLIDIPGEHSVFNATAALALSICILKKEKGEITAAHSEAMRRALESFQGSKRRSEIIGEAGGILFMDDYAHHPTAIHATLKGLKEYYPRKRLVVDFMSHTYSRTKALLPEFARCFQFADEVILHKIYASAREKDNGEISGSRLFSEVKKHHNNVSYFTEIMEAFPYLKKSLREGDLFITMGAGNNWQIAQALFAFFKGALIDPCLEGYFNGGGAL